jgi:predicted tellurium resistance membrane protein TerC
MTNDDCSSLVIRPSSPRKNMETLKNLIANHPNLSAWVALAVGMVAILVWEARKVGLEPMQWFWLIAITILVAGACIWIISWGEDEDEEGEAA